MILQRPDRPTGFRPSQFVVDRVPQRARRRPKKPLCNSEQGDRMLPHHSRRMAQGI
jgi:hypothetical protein